MSMRHTQQITKPWAWKAKKSHSTPSRGNRLSSSRGSPDQTTDVLFNGYRRSFPRGQNGGASNQKHLHPVPRLRMRGDIPAFPPHAFKSWRLITHTDNSSFTLSCVPSPVRSDEEVYEHKTQRYCANG